MEEGYRFGLGSRRLESLKFDICALVFAAFVESLFQEHIDGSDQTLRSGPVNHNENATMAMVRQIKTDVDF